MKWSFASIHKVSKERFDFFFLLNTVKVHMLILLHYCRQEVDDRGVRNFNQYQFRMTLGPLVLFLTSDRWFHSGIQSVKTVPSKYHYSCTEALPLILTYYHLDLLQVTEHP